MDAGRDRALVTGAAAGLGLAMVRRLLADGWHVVAVDREAAGLQRLEQEAGRRLSPVVADLADREALEELGATLAGQGPYRHIVLNAGISATGNFETIPADLHQAVVDINLTAPMALASALVRADAVTAGGSLVFISSLSRYVGYPGAAVYSATKEGVAVFARSLRRPLGRRKVRVMTVCPGPMDTAQAETHAPPGADRSKRMPPDQAAARILAAAGRPALAGLFLGGNVFVPGFAPKCAALAGRMFPGLATWAMRKAIFEKLGTG